MASISVARPPSSSAAGLLSMLSESDGPLRAAVLDRLLAVVDASWHEVAEYLPELEALAEDRDSSADARRRAAAVASRVFLHLDEPAQALRLALEAGGGDLLDGSARAGRLVGAALDAYAASRRRARGDVADDADEDDEDVAGVDPVALEEVVDRLLDKCRRDGRHDHALGIALEARDPRKVREVLAGRPSPPPGTACPVLAYATDAAANSVEDDAFRREVTTIVADELEREGDLRTTAPASAACGSRLGDPGRVANTLARLLRESAAEGDEHELLAYQIAFDVADGGDRGMAVRVAESLKERTSATTMTMTTTTTSTTEGEETTETSTAPSSSSADVSPDALAKLDKVLIGGFPSELALSFLHRNSDSDRRVMDNLKSSLEERGGSRNSVLHNCAVMAHSYLNAGTTNDSFLRDNLDWMRKASNWAKFSATASLGVIHARHTTEAMTLLEPYLPATPADASAVSPTGGYSEGGSLYALGLVHASHGGDSSDTLSLLRTHLRLSHANEVVSHGAALGVGLTALGSGDPVVADELRELLETDSAVAGEAAGVALGLVHVGRAMEPDLVDRLKDYARDTKHEKIVRGIALGLALSCHGREEAADAIIEQMRADRDPVTRHGAQYAVAMAYCGTGSDRAVRALLHAAVSDVDDDVRAAAVVAVAFVLHRTPARVPELVRLLAESFNPRVRYASCMAVGIAMAGTGDADSAALVEPMLEDSTDFVRQGALLGTAMIFMQQSDTNRKAKAFRERLASIVGDKHQTTLTKMGATLATGLLDAGGRNCRLSLGDRHGFTRVTSAVGLMLWLQHWHWFPMMHMLSVALTPTYTIGLNKDFKYPRNFTIQCHSKPSAFAYPKRLEEKKEKEKKRVETVTLSTTAKNKARLARKKKEEDKDKDKDKDDKKDDVDGNAMDVDDGPKNADADANADDAPMDVDDPAADDAAKAKPPSPPAKSPEPHEFALANPSRVTARQAALCSFSSDGRYRPVRRDAVVGGVVILTDETPDEEEDVAAIKTPSLDAEDEADPPEPFEWAPPGHADHVAAPPASTETGGDADATKESE